MKRRLTSLVIVWFTLFSVAVPAITCAAAAQHHACCPDQGQPPCGECPDRGPGPSAASGNCLDAPAPVANAAPIQQQDRKLALPDLVPAIVIAAPAQAPQAAPTWVGRLRWRSSHDLEIPTYLVTGRLRL